MNVCQKMRRSRVEKGNQPSSRDESDLFLNSKYSKKLYLFFFEEELLEEE